MNTNFILSFALMFGAAIALYCAILYGFNMRKKRMAAKLKQEETTD